MKVVIVTVYNSLNPGSFLQATSLYETIEKLGYPVAFLNTGARDLDRIARKEMYYLVRKGHFKDAITKKKVAQLYKRLLTRYKVVDTVDFDNDIVVLGSDEIWNVSRKEMTDYPVFWGKGLNYNRTISYAPSINLATEDDLRECDFALEALNNLRSISVRDKYSQDIIKTIANRDIMLECDPTILAYGEKYDGINADIPNKDYILIYAYNKHFSKNDIDSIRKFAKKQEKSILAFGIKQDWCDYYVNGSPSDFINYIKHADYVCTGTFHGTMLSIILKKQFAVLGMKKSEKVEQLLKEFDDSRITDCDNLENVLLTPIDTEGYDNKLKSMQANGIEFLVNNLKMISET